MRLFFTHTYRIYHLNVNFIRLLFRVFKNVANFRKVSFFTHTFFPAPKNFNFGSNSDAVENRMGDSESPSHGLVYPPLLGFRKKKFEKCFEKCKKCGVSLFMPTAAKKIHFHSVGASVV